MIGGYPLSQYLSANPERLSDEDVFVRTIHLEHFNLLSGGFEVNLLRREEGILLLAV